MSIDWKAAVEVLAVGDVCDNDDIEWAKEIFAAAVGDKVLYRIADEQETSRPGTEWHSIRLVQVYPEEKGG